MAQMKAQYVQYYTAGTAARKLAPVIPLNTPALPRTRAKQKRIKIYLDRTGKGFYDGRICAVPPGRK